MLTAMGLGVLAWRPCRDREARAPRLAIAMLLSAAAAVWVGSFALVAQVLTGATGSGNTFLAACGGVLVSLMSGALAPWQSALLVAWFVLLPGRAAWRVGADLLIAHRTLRRRGTAVEPVVGADGSRPRLFHRVVSIAGLGTPAVTLGVWRPVVAVDAGFWARAGAVERSVILTHECAHQDGRHGLVQIVTQALTSGLTPLPFARHVRDCVRRHLEALADDAAVRRHGADTVGRTLGQVALRVAPSHGLGASGDALWRVRRLIAPAPAKSWQDLALLGSMVLMMAGGLLLVAADTASAVPAWLTPSFCPI